MPDLFDTLGTPTSAPTENRTTRIFDGPMKGKVNSITPPRVTVDEYGPDYFYDVSGFNWDAEVGDSCLVLADEHNTVWAYAPVLAVGDGGDGGGDPDPEPEPIPEVAGDFEWSGHNWTWRTDAGAPTFNGLWASQSGTFVDTDGYLHLTLQRIGGIVYSTEIDSTRGGLNEAKWGYGTYRWVVEGPLDASYSNIILGLFTYDGTTGAPDTNNEIDLELGGWSWGDPAWDHTYFRPGVGADPPKTSVGLAQFPATADAVQTHEFVWEPGKITWRSWLNATGSGTPHQESVAIDGEAYDITTTGGHFTGTHVIPVPRNEQVMLNVWAYDENPLSLAADSPQTEFVIRSFTFTELTESDVTDAYVSVKSSPYSAVGDGTADDTAEIQEAIDAVHIAGGGVVFFPAGTYKITSELTIYDNITLRGVGRGVSIISQATSTENGITGHELVNVTIEDLGIHGPEAGTGTGISFTRDTAPDLGLQYRININRSFVMNFGYDGIYMEQPITSNLDQTEVQGCGRHGFVMTGIVDTGGASATSINFNACYANTNGTGSNVTGAVGGAGYYLDNMTYCNFNACAVDNYNTGYWIKDCAGVTFNGCGAEVGVDAGSGLHRGDGWLIAGSQGVQLNTSHIFQNKRYGVNITSSTLIPLSLAVTIVGLTQFGSQVGALNSMRWDANCGGTMLDCDDVDLAFTLHATARVKELNQDYSTFPGDLYVGGNLSVLGTGAAKSITFMPDQLSAGTGVTSIANPSTISDPDYLEIANAVDGFIGLSFIGPADLTLGSTMTISLVYTTSVSGGNVAVKQNSAGTAAGDAIFSAYTTSTVAAIPGASTANVVTHATLASTVPTQGGLEAGQWCRMALGFTRSTDAATDTNTGALRILGIRLNYT